jgi:hypothetical protein
VTPKPLPFETLHGESTIRFLGSVYATARTSVVVFLTGKHLLLLPGVFISYGMIREVGQGSRSSERMGGYDRFISLLFYVLQIIYVSYVHLYCFVCNHEFISYVLSYHIMTCLMPVNASNMSYLTVILIMLLSIYFQLFRHNACTMFICLLYLYDSYSLCSHVSYCYEYI